MLSDKEIESKAEYFIKNAEEYRNADAHTDHDERIGGRLFFGWPRDFFHFFHSAAEVVAEIGDNCWHSEMLA